MSVNEKLLKLCKSKTSTIDEIQKLLDLDANINYQEFHLTPLIVACKFNNMNVVKFLINSGANVNQINPCNEKAIDYIIDLDIMKYFVEELQINDLSNAIYYNITKQRIDIVDYLLSLPIDFILPYLNRQKRNPLVGACKFSNLDTVYRILNIPGVNVNILNRDGNSKAFISTIIYNDIQPLEIIKLLLFYDVKFNEVTDRGASPLSFAIYHDNTNEITKILINNKCNVNVFDNKKMTPLMIACQMNNVEIVELLLNSYPEIDISATCLFRKNAIDYSDNIIIKKMLLQKNCNYKDHTGKTPLLKYCLENNVEIVQFLVEECEDLLINEVEKFSNKTALHYACERGFDNIVYILLQNRYIDIYIIDKKRNRAIDYASNDIKKIFLNR